LKFGRDAKFCFFRALCCIHIVAVPEEMSKVTLRCSKHTTRLSEYAFLHRAPTAQLRLRIPRSAEHQFGQLIPHVIFQRNGFFNKLDGRDS
jgi:hypothetical protein